MKKSIKIRRTWTRHPAERIKENKTKPSNNPCDNCKLFLKYPDICIECINNESKEK